MNFYEILGIESNASSMDIERAIRLARQRGDVDEKALMQARNYLIDPKMRKLYDKKMGIKAAPRVRGGSGLSSSMPFWIPVTVLVFLLVAGATGLHFARKDAAEKRMQAQDAKQQARMDEAQRQDEGGNRMVPQMTARSQAWQHSALMVLPSTQYMLAVSERQNPMSAYQTMKLILAREEGEVAHLALLAEKPMMCTDDCRIKVVFDEYNHYSLSARMEEYFLVATVTEDFVAMFARAGKVSVVLPDKDQSEFVFHYQALNGL